MEVRYPSKDDLLNLDWLFSFNHVIYSFQWVSSSHLHFSSGNACLHSLDG